MKKTILLLTCILFYHISFSQDIRNMITDQLIIKFKESNKPNSEKAISKQEFSNSALDKLNRMNKVQQIKLTGHKIDGDTYTLKFNADQNINALIETYEKTGLFDYVEPNYIGQGHGMRITPNDAYFHKQWSHYNDGTFTLSHATPDADIDSELAWDITQGDPDLVVAILDSGVKLDHPEFSGRIWANSAETANGSDSDQNGYVDDVNGGWDFASDDNNPKDNHGHGTNVAGIALASGNNGIGYAGMNWNSKLMACRILNDENFGYYSWWAEAIYYAVDNGASVINMSVGGNGASTTLEMAVNYAYIHNVSVVVSTGNQNSVIQYPARYENAFAIGSTDSDDTRTVPFFWDNFSGSNYGPQLDFVAPGNYINGLSYSSNTNYNSYWGGTSQAAPHVAGLISLLLSVNPSLSVDQIRTVLEESSEDQVGDSEDTQGWDKYYGHGRVNAFQALSNQLVTSLDDEQKLERVAIYPNPLADQNQLTIENLENSSYEINVFNSLGQRVYTLSTNNNTKRFVTISLPKLRKGTYLIRISDRINKSIKTKKLMIL